MVPVYFRKMKEFSDMFQEMAHTSTVTFLAMLKIFLVMLAAGVLVRKKVLTPVHIQGLTAATVDVFLPCMTFRSILTQLKPGEFTIWWVLPLAAVVMMLLGMALCALFFVGELSEKKNMIPIAGIHNAAYMVLPLGALLFPGQFALLSLYVFLFLLGQSPIIWSIGKYMTTAVRGSRFRWKDLLTPPLVSALIALLLVFSGIRDILLPSGNPPDGSFMDVILSALKLLGDATVPVALFVLGGVLGLSNIRTGSIKWDSIRVMLVKYLLLPAITLGVVYVLGIDKKNPLLATFLIIQSSAPPAIAIILQVNKYGGDEQKVGSVVLLAYLACLISMPFWLSVWNIVTSR